MQTAEPVMLSCYSAHGCSFKISIYPTLDFTVLGGPAASILCGANLVQCCLNGVSKGLKQQKKGMGCPCVVLKVPFTITP